MKMFLSLKFWEIWHLFRQFFLGKPLPLLSIYVDELPDSIESKYIYIIGENGFYWSIAFKCPCKCGKTVQLNLLPDAKPCWKIKNPSKGTLSLVPSVWSKKKCKSHYFIKNGLITWC